jgi:hypothetical protein
MRRRGLGRSVGCGALALVVTLIGAVPAGGQEGGDAGGDGDVTASDPGAERQASLVAVEDRRLIEVRTVTSLARWSGDVLDAPYRLGTTAGLTLVLTARSEPYTIEDLLELAPQTFLRMSDGSFLLAEHVIVVPGATLQLSRPGGLVLRLASGVDGFATIVSTGGVLQILGEDSDPVQIASWDVAAGTPDVEVVDGRAYVRAVGGQFVARHVEFTDLGFWSGRTGGLALTGTDRPDTGAIETVDRPDDQSAGVLDGVTIQPAGPLTAGQDGHRLGYDVPASNYVSVSLDHVTVQGNAFGLFVSGANGLEIVDAVFTGNLLGGVVLHRYVTNGTIARTTSSDNGGDGFTIARATSSITITEATAEGNAENGFRLDGRALAETPSAVGASLRSYGNNSVSNSTASGNGRFGIVVNGGINIGLQNNRIEGHDMGIWVSGPAERISVVGNTVSGSDRHGIAIVDGVADATATGNVVDGASTGVYVRDSAADVTGNTITGARSHGVAFVGDADGSVASFNVLAGQGASALDLGRSHGDVDSTTNNTDGWDDTTGWARILGKLLQPMTALWVVLSALLVVSAIRGRRGDRTIEHPYARQASHYEELPPVPIIDLTGRRELELAGQQGRSA